MVGDGSCTFKFKFVLIDQGVDDLLAILCSDDKVFNVDSDVLVDLMLLVQLHTYVEFSFTWSESHFAKTIGEFVIPT